MRVILYKTEKKPVEIECKNINELLFGETTKIELFHNWCVVFLQEENRKKDRAKYHRNVCVPKIENGRVKVNLMPLYGDFILCKFNENTFGDIDEEYKYEIMAMFGF